MHVFGLEQIKQVLPDLDLFPLIKDGFKAYSSGRTVVPPVGELIFDDPPGDVHIKYGYIKGDDYFVIKIASGFYENSELGAASSQGGMMLLFDQYTGREKGVLVDECHLTNVRTAVAGAICAEALAPGQVRSIGVLGTGVQARMQVSYLSTVTKCRQVKVWGRNEQKMFKYQNEMRKEGWQVETCTDPGYVAASCDLIITATPTKTPLLRDIDVSKGTHITAMGSDSPGKQELETGILEKADLIVADSILQCRERGEIVHGLSEGVINEKDIIELGAILDEKASGRTSDDQITIADLTGVAVQDIQIAKAVFEACNKGA
tara:strand:- start:10152 stop:11108 length:957 start_codon:yes stop_codon:yes gene_type:complete